MRRLISAVAAIAAIAALTAAPGCRTAKKTNDIFEAVSPEVAGTAVPRGSMATVRSSPGIRVYSTGRRIDPANPNIMHEAGTMYVVGGDGAWNLAPNHSPLDPRHNREITISAPLTAEKQLEIGELRKTNQLMLDLGKALLDMREEYRTSTAAYGKSSETSLSEIRRISAKLETLERQYTSVMQKLANLQLKIDERGKQRSKTP